MESATIAHGHHAEEHHGPPEAHESSRIDKQTLGILLFIISEVMLFGAFFASYFFLRVVVAPESWPPEPYELPVAVAGINTVILVSSSFTIHYALEAIRRGNHAGLKLGLFVTWLLGAAFLFIQVNEYVHLGFSARDLGFGSIFYSLTGLHGAHVFVGLLLLTFATIRACRGHFGPEAKDHLGVEVPGIYWHFVDIMWIVVFLTVYVL
ncbi:MAG TPA: cytochrome c oxidase subunit 3 [Solirubrobacterales bacterium]|nr:cytochrome c oxidase subunit 3 [Solirubrobacterales bacterium]